MNRQVGGWTDRRMEWRSDRVTCKGQAVGFLWSLNHTPESVLLVCELSQRYTWPLFGIRNTLCNL